MLCQHFWLLFNNVCCFVIDCQVNNVVFPMGSYGYWHYAAYVILTSAEDVDKAVTKNLCSIGKNLVKG